MINCVAGEENGVGHDNTINPYKEDKKLSFSRKACPLQTGIWNEIMYYNYKFIINGNNKDE